MCAIDSVILLYTYLLLSVDKNNETTIVPGSKENKFGPWKNPIGYYIGNYRIHHTVVNAIKELEKHTCLKFAQHDKKFENEEGFNFYTSNDYWECNTGNIGFTSNTSHKNFYLGQHCYDRVPFVQGVIHKGLGIIPDNNRPDRNKYITIYMDRVKDKFRYKYDITKRKDQYLNEVSYDYGSITHAHKWDYSKIPETYVFVSKEYVHFYEKTMGQKQIVTFSDYKKLNLMLCNDSCTIYDWQDLSCMNSGYPNPKNCKECLCPLGFEGTRCENIERGGKNVENYAKIYNPSILKATNEISEKFVLFGLKNYFTKVETDKGKHVCLTVLKVRTAETQVCRTGYSTEIRYRKDKGVTGVCLCNKHYEPIDFKSEDNFILVIFNGVTQTSILEFVYKNCPDKKSK